MKNGDWLGLKGEKQGEGMLRSPPVEGNTKSKSMEVENPEYEQELPSGGSGSIGEVDGGGAR